MDNNDFDGFLDEIRNPEPQPKMVEELAKQRGIIGDFAVRQCEQLRKDAGKPTAIDPLDVEQAVMQERIRKAISTPIEPGQVFNAGSGEPLGKRAESKPVEDDLMRLLDLEREPQTIFDSVPADRITIPPGPALRKRAGGAGTSFLSQPMGDVFEAVAKRSTGRAAQFARELSNRAREMGV